MNDWQDYIRFRDEFESVLDPERYTIGWLDRQILYGEFNIWATEKAAIIAKLEEYPTGASDVHGMLAAGDLNDIIETLIPAAEAYGKEQGCIGAKIESREAWVRALKDSGYVLHQCVVRKEL